MSWDQVLLGELCTIQSGSSNTQDADPNGPYIFFDRSKKPKRSNKFLFDCEALIIAGEGAEFRPKRANGKFDLHQRAYAIFGFGDRLLGDYLFYYLEHVHRYFQEVAVGATVKSLRQRHFENLPVSLPPPEEQKRIVAVLDQAFAALDRARALAEANLANAEGVLALATDALCRNARSNWVTSKMGDYCAFEGGFAFKSGDAVDRSDVQIVRIGNLYKNVLDLDRNPAFYPSEFSTRYARFKLSPGEIIMSLTGTVGKQDYGFAVEVPNTERALLLNQRVARITPKDRKVLSSQFLLRFLRSGNFLSRLYQISRGTRQANLSTKDIGDLEMTMPPLRDQLEIVEQLETVEAQTASLRQTYLSQANDISDLRQSFLRKAFAGELT